MSFNKHILEFLSSYLNPTTKLSNFTNHHSHIDLYAIMVKSINGPDISVKVKPCIGYTSSEVKLIAIIPGIHTAVNTINK